MSATVPTLTLNLALCRVDESARSKEEIVRILTEINKIWKPAEIQFEPSVIDPYLPPEGLPLSSLTDQDLATFVRPMRSAGRLTVTGDATVFFVPGLFAEPQRHSNGRHLRRTNYVFVSDTIMLHRTGIFERNRSEDAGSVIAHELGHVLGLALNNAHYLDASLLMGQASDGNKLLATDIGIARNVAQQLLADRSPNISTTSP